MIKLRPHWRLLAIQCMHGESLHGRVKLEVLRMETVVVEIPYTS